MTEEGGGGLEGGSAGRGDRTGGGGITHYFLGNLFVLVM